MSLTKVTHSMILGACSNILDFGADSTGVSASDAAFVLAAAQGKPILLPVGTYKITTPITIPVSMYGQGPADGQTTIELTGTGQLIVGDWHCHWDGFLVESAVDSLTFVKCAQSFFTFTNYRLFTVGATGQTGVNFDCSANSVYFCNLNNFKHKLQYPVSITGVAPNVFNANTIGASARDNWQDFASAISIAGVSACDANEFNGYFEVGTNIVSFTATVLRQNRFNLTNDNVTHVLSSTVAISDVNEWTILDGGFTVTGTYPQNQLLIGPAATRVRGTNTTADSIPNASSTVLKYDTETFDTLSEFANGSGVFTPKNAGYYQVDCAAQSASVAWAAGTRWVVSIFKNGIEYAQGDYNAADAATTRIRGSKATALVYCNGTTDYIDSRVIHNQGGSVAIDTAPVANYFNATRVA